MSNFLAPIGPARIRQSWREIGNVTKTPDDCGRISIIDLESAAIMFHMLGVTEGIIRSMRAACS